MKNTTALVASLVIGLSFTTAHPLSASPVLWGDATLIAADTDVSTVGSLVYAYNFGDSAAVSSTTVNGVTFDPFGVNIGSNFAGVGDVAVTASNFFAAFGATAPPPGLSSAYEALFTAKVAGFFDDITLTLGGLTSGQTYQVQFWANSQGNPLAAVVTSGNSVTLDYSTAFAGQWAIGTFTADAPTQVFTVTTPDSFPLINALQLRDVTPVPEPQEYAIAIAGLLGTVIFFRRRRRV